MRFFRCPYSFIRDLGVKTFDTFNRFGRLVTTIVSACIIFYLISSTSQAAYNGDFSPRVEKVERLPEVLYHWTNRNRLNTWALKIEANNQKLIFPYTLKKESQFVNSWKAFSRRRGVFAWTNPMLGAQGVMHESYSTNADLVAFEISPEARAIRVISNRNTTIDHSAVLKVAGVNLRDVQLIEHITPELHEWIILDPKAVRSFTADPKITYPKVWEAMQPYLKDPFYRPPLSEIHFRYGEKYLDPVWNSNDPSLRSTWSLSVVLLRLSENFTVNPESPYYDAKVAAKSTTDNFNQSLAKVMMPVVRLTCEGLFENTTTSTQFNLGSLNQRIQEFRL